MANQRPDGPPPMPGKPLNRDNHDVPGHGIRIAFSSRARRSTLRAAVLFSATLTALVIWFVGSNAPHGLHTAGPWLAGTILASPAPAFWCHRVWRVFGSATLTDTGITWHTLTSRRFVPWTDIADFDVEVHTGDRFGGWGVVRAYLPGGRTANLPGVMHGTRLDTRAEFNEKVATLRSHWAAAQE
ncbi:hypothetical protein ABUW04_00160 [Streptacidiphilus sp. N1-10]|uniref:PH domain-containing protein n=1 Tax=Streptacidiphilus jeojiensis TaxID=3229225 RepID=A0ABV6XF57_9ACTN